MPNDARSPVRITPAYFYLLLALAEGARHGYAMAREVEERSAGAIELGPGSLYHSLGRLADAGLIEEVAAPRDERDERRRYYALTRRGREVLRHEAEVLDRALAYAREKRVV